MVRSTIIRLTVIAALALGGYASACGTKASGCTCNHGLMDAKADKVPTAVVNDGHAVAATCQCEGKADCTCKKNACGCKKCEPRLIAPIKGAKSLPIVPHNSRQDASAGIFI